MWLVWTRARTIRSKHLSKLIESEQPFIWSCSFWMDPDHPFLPEADTQIYNCSPYASIPLCISLNLISHQIPLCLSRFPSPVFCLFNSPQPQRNTKRKKNKRKSIEIMIVTSHILQPLCFSPTPPLQTSLWKFSLFPCQESFLVFVFSSFPDQQESVLLSIFYNSRKVVFIASHDWGPQPQPFSFTFLSLFIFSFSFILFTRSEWGQQPRLWMWVAVFVGSRGRGFYSDRLWERGGGGWPAEKGSAFFASIAGGPFQEIFGCLQEYWQEGALCNGDRIAN